MPITERIIQIVILGVFVATALIPFIIIFLRAKKYFATRNARRVLQESPSTPSPSAPIAKYLPLLEKSLKKQIYGLEELSYDELQMQLRNGSRFVCYSIVISAAIITSRNSTEIYLVRPDRNSPAARWASTFFTFIFGWWGFPYGIIYTPQALVRNCKGGIDRTNEVVEILDSFFGEERLAHCLESRETAPDRTSSVQLPA